MCFCLGRLKDAVVKISSRLMAKRFKMDRNTTVTGEVENSNSVHTGHIRPVTYLRPPVKSKSDKKKYRVIKLRNGLTALLISDKSEGYKSNKILKQSENVDPVESECESTDCSGEESDHSLGDGGEESLWSISNSDDEKLAACALSVGVGSFSDPEKIQGLAHFLEHMIFMGSEKFPKENEFDTFIKKKGGSDNAYTECEYTTYYFDCHETHLSPAMNIFSELFISPLMKREMMTKERESIESEFQMSLPDDESRISQLLCSLANINNPVRKFMWGNLITLKDNISDDELYEAVHEFRRRHYSAHRMTLAVQAKLPLGTLEKWVIEYFQNVPNNGLPPDKFNINGSPFNKEKFSKLYIVEPVNNINNLQITWVFPSVLKMYKFKPLNYISWVIGHEGKGSLFSYLKKKMWSIGITARGGGDGSEENSLYTLFSISLALTQKGAQNVEEILNSVFAYIKMFQDTGPQERLFKEIQLIAKTSFKYAEEISSADNVEQLSEKMQFYPSNDYIIGSELFFQYDETLIKSFLNELKSDNLNIMICSKILSSNEKLENVEPWFGTKYQTKEIPAEWIKNWKNVQKNEDFHLPEENPFITKNFALLPEPENHSEFPERICKDELIEVWYKQDITFKLPHAYCCLHLISPLAQKSAQNAVMLDLYVYILKQALTEELYPAIVAELGYDFHLGDKGIIIGVNGFNEKLKVLLKVILENLKTGSRILTADTVLAYKEELKRSYINSNLKTSSLVRDIRMSILLEKYWSALDKEKALKDVTHETLKDLLNHYFEQLFVQCLIQGNISKQEAAEFGEMVKVILMYKPLSPENTPKIQVNKLPIGEKFCVVRSFNFEDVNSVVTNYYQSGLGTIQESSLIELMVMMMEEPIFDTLRTQQQLGYDVSCSLRDTFGILGFSISVYCQSDRNSVDLVESRITQFLSDFLETLKKTTQDEFKEMQESLIKLKKVKDVHLKEEFKRNWEEIKTEDYAFDRHQKEREFIKNLTLEEVILWFESKTGTNGRKNFKKLSVQVVGLNDDEKDSGKEVTRTVDELSFLSQQERSDKFIFNIGDFKKSLSLYPVHKIM